jgi:hypothetical protein
MNVAPETLLWNGRVDPALFNENGGAYDFPALAMAALPFRYWTGTLKFRFQIVCSAFHKGRLKIVYDPSYIDTNEYNTNYLEVIDIAETQDFTIEIGNGQERTLLERAVPGTDNQSWMFNTTPLFPASYGNGVVGVFVVNELTTPNSTINNDIQINVFVSAGDDFEVFVPSDDFQKFTFKPQSGLEPQSGMEENNGESEGVPAPQTLSSDILGTGVQSTELVNKVFVGEAITSFRPLLKRYNRWRRERTCASFTTPTYSRITTLKNNFPFYRGNVPGAVDRRVGDIPYNYVNKVLLHWVCAAFSGWRGSIRYKMVFDKINKSNTNDHIASQIYISRQTEQVPSQPSYSRSIGAETAYASDNECSRRILANMTLQTGTEGMLYATDTINPTVEFEVPYQTPFRFTPGKILNYTDGSKRTFTPSWAMEARIYGNPQSGVDYHVAAGEDFQTYFFTGLPRVYLESIPPDPL